MAAMSIAFPTSRLKADRISEIAQALLEAANAISTHS
jgi:DNA-binding IclR family transcriptional regulator